ncbi:MAG: DUF3014 domain-containing protein [Gammaproteobacteria bacterium]|nr:DUF3014 domain-containing protein [Gammaproteobacteria bacterium]
MNKDPIGENTETGETEVRRRGRGIVPGIAAVIVIIVGGYLYLTYQDRQSGAPAPAPQAVEEAPPQEPDALVRNPVPEAAPTEPADPFAALLPDPLPALGDSDAVMLKLAEFLLARPDLVALVVPQEVIRRIVITVENIPARNVPQNRLPLMQPEGKFASVKGGEEFVIDEANYARYTRYAALMDAIDARRLVDAYVHLYPLFQNAYRELGYPKAYFNDRLILAIDNLLATPEVTGPVSLVQPAVFFRYADPGLEALSAGQKLLLRMGPENAAVVKVKLAELRKELMR